jgi:flagellar hook-length control protein FliK
MLNLNIATSALTNFAAPTTNMQRDAVDGGAEFAQELQRATATQPPAEQAGKPSNAQPERQARGADGTDSDESRSGTPTPPAQPAHKASAADAAQARSARARQASSAEGRAAREAKDAGAGPTDGPADVGGEVAPELPETMTGAALDVGTQALPPQDARSLQTIPMGTLDDAGSADAALASTSEPASPAVGALGGERTELPAQRTDHAKPHGHGTGRGGAEAGPSATAIGTADDMGAAQGGSESTLRGLEHRLSETGSNPAAPAAGARQADATLWAATWSEARHESLAGAPPGARTAAGDMHTDSVAVPLDSDGFAPALGARLAVLARDGIEQARLNVHPAELGPIAVRLALEGAQVRVDMSAEFQATRQALEQALPALAGALRESGFTLAGGGVFQQAPQDQGAQGRSSAVAPFDARDSDGSEPASSSVSLRPVHGLVDVFA